MAGLGELFRSLLGFAVGSSEFYFSAWLAVTGVLVCAAASAAAIGARVIDPPAVLIATRPARVVAWMGIIVVAAPLVLFVLTISVFGIPLAIVGAFLWPLTGLAGYVAAALVYGDRLGRAFGVRLTPWGAAVVGVLVFRLVRLVPFVGATLHSLIAWFCLAAVSALLWDLAYSWHRRRLPDDRQFDNSGLIEWDPERGPLPPGAPPPPSP